MQLNCVKRYRRELRERQSRKGEMEMEIDSTGRTVDGMGWLYEDKLGTFKVLSLLPMHVHTYSDPHPKHAPAISGAKGNGRASAGRPFSRWPIHVWLDEPTS
jgi:hypothetical protein